MFKPNYQITDKILYDLTKITEIKAQIEKSNIIPAREAFLRKVATIGMAHSSTSIEGNTLNKFQVEKLAKGEKISAQAREILEVKNYLKALKLVDKIHESKKSIGVKEILDIHKTVIAGLISEEKVGAFRKGPVYIVNIDANGNESLVYTPPKYDEVEPLITELIEWLKRDQGIHPIIRAGIFHYQFVSMHPFIDGNGRSTRLLTLLYLYLSGYTFKKSLVLEDFYNNNRKRYYENLQTGETFSERLNADLTGWLEYFVEGFLFDAQILRDQIISFPSKADSQVVLNADELRIVDFTLNLGRIESGDAVDILDVPKRTAQDKLKKLVDLKILKKMGSGPTTYYVLK